MSTASTKSTRTIYTFRAVRTGEGFDPAKDFVVCPWGTVQTRKGPVTVNDKTLCVFDANQKAERRDKIAGDFNHNTLREKEPVKVAGWWNPRVVKDQGIVVSLSSLTPEIQLVKDGHYPDLSPAIERDDNGVVISLHSFAFCRHGEMAHPDLEIFSVDVPEAAGAVPHKSTQHTRTVTMTPLNEAFADLLTTLTGENVAADATPEAMIAAVSKAKAKLGGGGAAPSEMSAEFKKLFEPLAQQITGLKTQFDTFSAKQTESGIELLITAATDAGKKIGLKKERIVAMGAEGAKEYLDSLEAGVVKVDGGHQRNNNVNGANKGKTGEKVTDVFSAEQILIFKRNGVDPKEMLKAHNDRIAAMSADGDDDDPEPEEEPAKEGTETVTT